MEQPGREAGLSRAASAQQGAGHPGRALTRKPRAWEVFHLSKIKSFLHRLMTAGYDEQIKTNFKVTPGHNCQAFIQETLQTST